MLQLLVPNVDNEKIFEKIAERKTYKNSHCKECEDDITCVLTSGIH